MGIIQKTDEIIALSNKLVDGLQLSRKNNEEITGLTKELLHKLKNLKELIDKTD